MTPFVSVLIAILIGYLCGSLPWGLWIGRAFRGLDIREHGSKNLGATNVYRTLGPGLGVLTLLLDIGKGALPVWLTPRLEFMSAFPGGASWCAVTVAIAAVLGHVFTVFAGFKGGRGVATTFGVMLALSPMASLVFVGVFLATLFTTRFVSLSSILGMLAYCIGLWWLAPGSWQSPTFVLGVLLAVVVIARHKDNLGRLARGEERRFAWTRGGQS